MSKLITIYDPSVEIVDVEIHYQKSIKYGRVNQRKVRTEKRRRTAFFVQIEAKDGITHSLEKRRVHAALREKFGHEFPTLRRNVDGTYTIAIVEQFDNVAILENGSRISGRRDRLAKRAASIAEAQGTRVVEIQRIAA